METLLQVQEICKYYRMGEVQITAVDAAGKLRSSWLSSAEGDC